MTEQAPRPGQTTFAGWLIIGGSAILVIAAWQRIAGLHTLEVQDQLRKVLAEPPIDGTGLTVSALSDTIRVLSMVAAGAATASAILGLQALRRSTSARIALTCLAPLVLIGGLATAGFFAPMVVAGVVMLWLRPTRDWFAGRPWRSERATPQDPNRPDPFAVPPAPPVVPPVEQPRPQAAASPFAHVAPPAHPVTIPRPARPAALVAACVVTWISTALVGGVMGLTALVLAVMPDEVFDEAERQHVDFQGMSRGELTSAALVVAGVAIVWCVVAAVLAGLTFARVRWAWVALIVSSAVAGLVMLVMALPAPYLVVLVAAAAVTCSLLLRPDVRLWFRR